MIQRGEPRVSVRVETKRVKDVTVGVLLAFADELREAGAPLTAPVGFDRDTGSPWLERLRCSWSEDGPHVVVEGRVASRA